MITTLIDKNGDIKEWKMRHGNSDDAPAIGGGGGGKTLVNKTPVMGFWTTKKYTMRDGRTLVL